MAIAYDSTGTGVKPAGFASDYTWTHTCVAACNYIVVAIAIRSSASEDITSVTVDGNALDQLGSDEPAPGQYILTTFWGKNIALSAGAHAMVGVRSGAFSQRGVMQSMAFTGWASSRTVQQASAATLNVTSAAGELIVSAYGAYCATNPGSATAGIDNETSTQSATAVNDPVLSIGTKAGAAPTVTVTWTPTNTSANYDGIFALSMAGATGGIGLAGVNAGIGRGIGLGISNVG